MPLPTVTSVTLRCLENAGGNATFDEVLTFHDKELFECVMRVRVLDHNDLLPETFLGESTVNLNHYKLQQDGKTDKEGPEAVEVLSGMGQLAG